MSSECPHLTHEWWHASARAKRLFSTVNAGAGAAVDEVAAEAVVEPVSVDGDVRRPPRQQAQSPLRRPVPAVGEPAGAHHHRVGVIEVERDGVSCPQGCEAVALEDEMARALGDDTPVCAQRVHEEVADLDVLRVGQLEQLHSRARAANDREATRAAPADRQCRRIDVSAKDDRAAAPPERRDGRLELCGVRDVPCGRMGRLRQDRCRDGQHGHGRPGEREATGVARSRHSPTLRLLEAVPATAKGVCLARPRSIASTRVRTRPGISLVACQTSLPS